MSSALATAKAAWEEKRERKRQRRAVESADLASLGPAVTTTPIQPSPGPTTSDPVRTSAVCPPSAPFYGW
jgi:hypothetical protein